MNVLPKSQWYSVEFDQSSISSMERNKGWTTRPTARSVVASPQSKIIDGERREGVFHTTDKTRALPMIVVTRSRMLITQLDTMSFCGTFSARNTGKRKQEILSSIISCPWWQQLLYMLVTVSKSNKKSIPIKFFHRLSTRFFNLSLHRT